MKKSLFLLSVLLLCSCNGTNAISSSEGKPSINIIIPGFTSSEETSSENSKTSVSIVKPSTETNSSSSSANSSILSETESSGSVWGNETVANYYKSIDLTKTGTALMKDLEKLLDDTDNTSFTYSSAMFDVFKYTDDANPENPGSGNIVSFYSGKVSTKASMNKEHTWPDSRGGSKLEKDPHVIRPTISSENSARQNFFFNENSSWDPASFNNEKYRGIAARIIFYGAVKAYTEGLYLVDKTEDPQLSYINSITGRKWNPTMGKLSTLLKWNLEYDIDDTEILRNEVLYGYRFNHCRNPFIDNRDLACQIWGDTNADTQKVCNKNV